MPVEVFKSSAREKIQVVFLNFLWMMGGLYFFVRGYEFFHFPWAWGFLIILGLFACGCRLNQEQITLELRESVLLWKTFSSTTIIKYTDLKRVEENIDRNRLFFTMWTGRCYQLGLGDRNYKKLLRSLYKRAPHLGAHLLFPHRVWISVRYLLTFVAVIVSPAVSGGYCLYFSFSWFLMGVTCALVIFMIASVWLFLESLPLFYDFQEKQVAIHFLFKKRVEIPFIQIERSLLVLDKNGFWHCTLILRDASFKQISEVYMRKSLYLYFLFISRSRELLKNA